MARFNKPILTGDIARDIAKIDTWMAETTDQLNFLLSRMETHTTELEIKIRELEEKNNGEFI